MVDGKLTIIQKKIDDNHRDVLWYGGRIAEYSYRGYTFILGAYGDVYATLLDTGFGIELATVKDKNDSGEFYGEMSCLIQDDDELHFFEDVGRLDLPNNNWFEILVDGPDGKQYDVGWTTASDDYDEAVKEMIDNADAFIKEVSKIVVLE